MEERTAWHRGMREFIFASCTHNSGRTVRGVISSSRFSSAWIPPVRGEGIPTEAAHRSQPTGCVCGVPSYLVDLDECLEGYALENPVVRRSISNEVRQIKRSSTIKMRSRLLPDLQL